MKLSRKGRISLEDVRTVTGYSVVELAAFFEIYRRGVYLWKSQSDGFLPPARRYELMARRPELFKKSK